MNGGTLACDISYPFITSQSEVCNYPLEALIKSCCKKNQRIRQLPNMSGQIQERENYYPGADKIDFSNKSSVTGSSVDANEA